MANKKRTIWEDLMELGREVRERIDEALNPEKRRKPARVPAPIRNTHPEPHNEDHPY
ncbi:MAG: hypothetical protein Q9P01_19510 [Anaerolineae bacterium]|nr:hypothetical protein [Anaerolineae bacterium]MDQ7036939.1 hypothetical protein [Anaerolineae bacterium]